MGSGFKEKFLYKKNIGDYPILIFHEGTYTENDKKILCENYKSIEFIKFRSPTNQKKTPPITRTLPRAKHTNFQFTFIY